MNKKDKLLVMSPRAIAYLIQHGFKCKGYVPNKGAYFTNNRKLRQALDFHTVLTTFNINAMGN